MSRTNVRKHPPKSIANSAPNPRTRTNGPDCNTAAVPAKTEVPVLSSAITGTTATAEQRPSPCSITQNVPPQVLNITDLITDNSKLVRDLQPMSRQLPPRLAALREHDMTARKSGAQPRAASAEICKNYMAGRCKNANCRRIHPSSQDDRPVGAKGESPSQTTPAHGPLMPSRQPMGPPHCPNTLVATASADHGSQLDKRVQLNIPSVTASVPLPPSKQATEAPPIEDHEARGTRKEKCENDAPTAAPKSGRRYGKQRLQESKAPLAQDMETIPAQHETSNINADNISATHTSGQSPDFQDSAAGCGSEISQVKPTSAEDPLPPRDVCRLFMRDRCKQGSRCHRFHPPRYMWKELAPQRNKVCEAYLEGRCWLGTGCWMYHPPDEDLESSTESSQEEQPPPRRVAKKRNKKTRRAAREGSGKASTECSNLPLSLGAGTSSDPTVKTPPGPTISSRGNRNFDSEHTDGCSSDVTTYFSAASSSPSTSPSRAPKEIPPVSPPKSLPKRPVPVCIDFQRGSCRRQPCKYSHETELDRILNLLQSSATRPQEQLALQEHSVNEKEKSPVPRVPPGLGLENTIAISQPPPELRTLPVETAQVTFGSGFEVKQIQTSFESRKIFLKEIPSSIDETAIRDILLPFGTVQEIQLPEVRTKAASMVVRATFASYTEAAHAVAALNGARVFGCDIVAVLATHKSTSLGKGVVRDGDALIEFPAPCITGYLGFSTQELADQAVQRIKGTVECNVRLFADRYEGLPKAGKYNVKVLGLPPKTQIDDLARFGHDQGGMLAASPNYESLKDALRALQYLLEHYGELVVINVQEPPYIRQVVRVSAQFTTPDAAANACIALNGRPKGFCGKGKVYAHHVRTVHYKLPPNVFAVIEPEILSLRARVCSERRYDDIVISRRRENPDAPVNVKLLADTLPSLTKLKQAFEEILRGERVLENGEPLWDPFFNRAASDSFFHELEQRYDMLINKDNRRRMLALFGSPEKRRAAREAIRAHVRYLQSQTVRKFSLEGRVIGLFMSADLMKLQQSLGHENVELDMTKRVLTVRGDEAAFIATEDILRKVRHRHVLERMKRGDECPVCFSEVTLPVTLPCGHTWCKSCLVNYCNAAVDTRVFPLKCLGNEARCSQCIPMHIARQVLSPAQLSAVARSAYLAYVHARPKEFYYCPTPDCPQIYRTAPPDTVLQCPSCLVRICGNCHVEYHEGSFCPDRDAEDRSLFEKWTEGHDVKRCPGCKAPIERIAGCNHMTCTRCHTHLCWVCLATFSNSHDVYNHMHAMHGGIGI